MTRKKNHNQDKLNEQKEREKQLREEMERKIKNKKKQQELIENLCKTYSHIKPTIIQGQRILKVIEEMSKQINYLSYIGSNLIQSITETELVRLSPFTQVFLTDLKEKENEISEIKTEIYLKTQDFNAYKSEEEDENEMEEELNKEQKEILEKINNFESKLFLIEENMGQQIKKFIRLLNKNDEDFEILKEINKRLHPIENMNDVQDCIKAINFLFVKKLSTGYDEEESHKTLLERLEMNIDFNKKLEENKKKELKELEENKKKKILEKNEEIESLRKELSSLNKKEEENINNLIEKSMKNRKIEEEKHELKKKNFKNLIEKVQNDLEELEKKNMEEEIALNKENDVSTKRLTDLIKMYDTTIEEKQNKYQLLEDEHQNILDEIKKIEDKCKLIKYDKKVNKKLIDEWDKKINDLEVEEKRKQNSANLILNLWKIWKKNKSKKKRKKKKKKIKKKK